MKHLKKVLITLMLYLMSCSLLISPLMGVEYFEGPTQITVDPGEIIYIYTQEEQDLIGASLQELTEWRTKWPQVQMNYENVIDSNEIWRTNYSKSQAANYDLRVQRNVSLGVSGVTIVLFIAYFLFNPGIN